MNNLDQSFKGKPLLILFIIVVGIAAYQFFFNKKIDEKGIYTKCTVINSEGYKGGIIITIKYKYREKEYVERMNSTLGDGAIGNQYFIKLLPKSPDAVLFVKEPFVPTCLLAIEAPSEGWKEIPTCK